MTAATIYGRCRKAGIRLAADGDSIIFEAPAGVMVPVDAIRRVKPELLSLLSGEYLNAAQALVLRIGNPEQREALAELFDERVGICQYDGNLEQGPAERIAYQELAEAVDQAPKRAADLNGSHT